MLASSEEPTLLGRLQPKAARAEVIEGQPDPERVSTSCIEWQNLTMRMGMSRYARKTNAFSKKFENHCHVTAIHYLYYNFARPHLSLNGVAPAVAAGLTRRTWSLADIVRIFGKDAVRPQR